MNELKKNKVLQTIQSRKFLVSVVTIIMAIGLYLLGHITIDQMIEIIRPMAITYVGALGLIDMVRGLLPVIESVLKKS